MPVVPSDAVVPMHLIKQAEGPWSLNLRGPNAKTVLLVDKARDKWEELHGDLTPLTYQRLALRTASDFERPGEDFLMAAVGLNGELEEFLDVTGPIEFGDVQWYLALAWHAFEQVKPRPRDAKPLGQEPLGIVSLPEMAEHEAHLFRLVAKLQELAKKVYWHGHPLLDVRPPALELLGAIEQILGRWPHTHGWDYHGIWAMNIWKLINRHPEGFQTLEEDTNGSK